MEIVNQTIRIIDYENNAVYKRDTPDEFSDYVRQLITYINSNTSIREYCTRSVNTEVISCILDIIHNQLDEEFVTEKIDAIAKRLLIKECAAQTTVAHMTNVQKGSLIQALLYDDERDKYTYLLAKVEHTDFVDDSDFSFKSGFVERFPEFSLFYRLFSPLDSEMICIFPYFYPCEESAREIREIFI